MGFIRNLHAPRGFIADRLVYSYLELEVYAGKHGLVVTDIDHEEYDDLTFYMNTIYFFDNPENLEKAIEIVKEAYQRYREEWGEMPKFLEPFGAPRGITTTYLSFKESHILIVDDNRLLELMYQLGRGYIIDPYEEARRGAIYIMIPEGTLLQEHVIRYCEELEERGTLKEGEMVDDCRWDIVDKLAEKWKTIVGDPEMLVLSGKYEGIEAYIRAKPYLPEHEDHWLNYMYNILGVTHIFTWMRENDNERKYILMVNKELEPLLKEILY